jgi:uncharacterized protein (TIGR03118 family)
MPTGVVFNDGPGFVVSANGISAASVFLFATEDGLIAGWNPNVDATHALVAVDNPSTRASYKGLALGTDSNGHTLLYATNFNGGTVDVFDQNFQAVHKAGSFSDPNLPVGYAPFGIQNINGKLYVTYAQQDAAKYDSVPGNGSGYIDVFDGDGVLQQRLVSQGPLNSPWGLALAPASFGEFSQDLLVGNFGDGRINVFEPTTGQFLGQLDDAQGQPIVIQDLWGLEFGNGAGAGSTHTLFFSAGLDNQRHGLFGKLQSTQATDGDAATTAGSGGSIYLTQPDSAASDSDDDEPAGSVDNYPLPPASGPVPRADIDAQPRALPLSFPLQTSAADLAPALLTVSEVPRGATFVSTPATLVAVSGNGVGFDAPAAPSALSGAFNAGAGAANSSADSMEVAQSNGTRALDVLLSLPTQPDITQRKVPTSAPTAANRPSAADTTATKVQAEPSYPLPAADSPVIATEEPITDTIQDQNDPKGISDKPPATPKSAGVLKLPVEHKWPLETMDIVTVLLVTGGTCLMLGVGHVARSVNRRESRDLLPGLDREYLAPGS